MPIYLEDDEYGVNINLLHTMAKGASSIRLYPATQSNRAARVELDFCKLKVAKSATSKLKEEVIRLQNLLIANNIISWIFGRTQVRLY